MQTKPTAVPATFVTRRSSLGGDDSATKINRIYIKDRQIGLTVNEAFVILC